MTFYEVLGVAPDASRDEITDAYRDRVKETHPDRNDSEDASEQFQRVAEAEEVLGDPVERARYDRLGHVAYRRTVGGSDGPGRGRNGRGEARRGDGDDGRAGRGGRGDRSDDGSSDGDEQDWADGPFGNRNRRREYPGSDREAPGDGNRSRRSYYVGDAGTAASEAARSAGGGATSGSSRSGASASTDGGATASDRGAAASVRHARRKKRGRGEHVGGDEGDEWTGFSVRDWDDADLEREPVRVRLSHQSLVVVGLTFVMYPFLAFMTVAPVVALHVNVVVGACTLLLLGYLFTIPRVSMVGFGALSVLVPLVLAFVGVDLLAPMSLFLVGACLGPFGYSILFARIVG